MTDLLSVESLAFLRKCGWHEGRRVDLTELGQTLADWGLPLNEYAAEVLGELYGVHCPLYSWRVGGLSEMGFRPEFVLEDAQRHNVGQLLKLYPRPLCPVGIGGRFMLFAADDGVAVYLHDEWLYTVTAPSMRVALKHIFDSGVKLSGPFDITEDQWPT